MFGAMTGLSGLSGTVGGAATVYVKDLFTDTNGTALTAHTMDIGSGWTKDAGALGGGTINIQSNQAQTNAADGLRKLYVTESNKSDVTITCAMSGGYVTGEFSFIVARYVDSNNFWLLGYKDNTSSSLLVIFEVLASVVTQRASASIAQQTSFNATATCYGAALGITVNGVTCSYSSTDLQTATKHGIDSSQDNTINFDNFMVTS